jgi:hypothetical protein
MDPDGRKLSGNLQFLLKFKGYPRSLFTIPKGGIENSDLSFAAVFNKEDNRPRPCWCESYS